MQKRIWLVAAFVLTTINLFSQVHKRFLDDNYSYIKDSIKARHYILYQKQEDSSYSAVMLNMRNIPEFEGTYKDEELYVRHGKFTFYRIVLNQQKVNEHSSTIDSLIKIDHKGFYLNGLKEGIWIDYDLRGNKKYMATYENNQRNGPFEEYYDNGRIYSRRNYINGSIEGDSYIFRPDSSIQEYTKYWHNRIIDSKEYGVQDLFYNAEPGYNFSLNIFNYLKKQGLSASHGSVVVTFTIKADGKLSNPKLNMGVNPNLDKAIIEAVLNSPRWVPAQRNKKKVEQEITLALNYDTKE